MKLKTKTLVHSMCSDYLATCFVLLQCKLKMEPSEASTQPSEVSQTLKFSFRGAWSLYWRIM